MIMAPRPYSERVPEPLDLKPLSEQLPGHQNRGDTPSPRTPTTGSPSPPPIQLPVEPTALVPILSDDGLPYDHTLPQYIRRVAGEPSLEEVHNMTLRVMTETASLQQMTLYTPNLRELNLEGSGLASLRDIGSELRFLQVLRIGRCHLRCLDGTLGLTSLRELYAAGNHITSAAPCAHLSRLRTLDLSRNQLQDPRSLSFLASCKNLQSLNLEGNRAASHPNLRNLLQSTLPALLYLDNVAVGPQVTSRDDSTTSQPQIGSPRGFERQDSSHSSNTDSSSSRVSSASSNTGTYVASPIFPLPSELESAPGPSSEASISKWTSGAILCGNIASQRRRRPSISSDQTEESEKKDELAASRNWREAYYKFRELNEARWKEESEADKVEEIPQSDAESGERQEHSDPDNDPD